MDSKSMLLDIPQPRAQKIFYPINLSFSFLDSFSLANTRNRFIKISPMLERWLDLKMNSPEDNLNVYKQSVWLSHAMLVASYLLSTALPLIFMSFAQRIFEPRSPANWSVPLSFVFYWIFWISALMLVLSLFRGASWREAETNQRRRRSIDLMQTFRLRPAQVKEIILEAALVLVFYATVFYVSNHMENVIICHVQVAAVLFCLCFKVGRTLSLTTSELKGFVFLIFGMIVTILHFNLIKGAYSPWNGVFAIVAAFAAGTFWLLNHDGNISMNLTYKLILINTAITVMSFLVVLFFFSVMELFQFIKLHFFHILAYFIVMAASFTLKNKIAELYDDLIPKMLYITEPLLAYAIWEIWLKAPDTSDNSSGFGWLVHFLIFKLLLIAIFLILGQLFVIIEMKRSEVNLDGGRLGLRSDQLAQMRLEHAQDIIGMNIDDMDRPFRLSTASQPGVY